MRTFFLLSSDVCERTEILNYSFVPTTKRPLRFLIEAEDLGTRFCMNEEKVSSSPERNGRGERAAVAARRCGPPCAPAAFFGEVTSVRARVTLQRRSKYKLHF